MSSLGDRQPPKYAYCRECLKVRGQRLHIPIPTRIGMKERGTVLDKRTGRKSWLCALCLVRGKITYLD